MANGIMKLEAEEKKSAMLRPRMSLCNILRSKSLAAMKMTQDEPTMDRTLEVQPSTKRGMYLASSSISIEGDIVSEGKESSMVVELWFRSDFSSSPVSCDGIALQAIMMKKRLTFLRRDLNL